MSDDNSSELTGATDGNPSPTSATRRITIPLDMDASKGIWPFACQLLPDYDWDQLTREDQLTILMQMLSVVLSDELVFSKLNGSSEQWVPSPAAAADLALARETAAKIVARWGPVPSGPQESENTSEIDRLLAECYEKVKEETAPYHDQILTFARRASQEQLSFTIEDVEKFIKDGDKFLEDGESSAS